MEKQEFIERMDLLIRRIDVSNFFTCPAIKSALGVKAKDKYIKSIRHFFVAGKLYINWRKYTFNVCTDFKRREFRGKLLEDFKNECIESNAYEEF